MSEETVFGLNVSRIDADRLPRIAGIRREWLDIERTLQTGKWFEYRFLSPTAATYLFAHEYKKAYRTAYMRNIDTERGEHVTALPADLFKAKKQTISGIWRARQVADAMGMPYDVYLERALYWVTRYWRQSFLPRPKQLYSDLVTDRTTIDWDEYQRSKLYYSALPQYQNQVYDSRIAALNDHHEYLFAQIASRGNNVSLVARFLNEGLLPALKVHARLGPDILSEALALT